MDKSSLVRSKSDNVLFALSPFNCFSQFKRYEKASFVYNFQEGIGTIAAHVGSHGYNPFFYDGTLASTPETYVHDICQFATDNDIGILGIPCYSVDFMELVEFTHEIKKHIEDIVVVLGNVHPTNYPADTLTIANDVDFVVLGEGEGPFLKLCDALCKGAPLEEIHGIAWRENGNICVNKTNPPLDIRQTPSPAYDIFPMKEYSLQPTLVKKYPTYTLMASRGCAFNCAFCDVKSMMGRKVRYRPPSEVVANMELLAKDYGAQGFAFQDSTLTTSKKWIDEFCELYMKSGLNMPWFAYSRVDTITREIIKLMKQAGCWCLSFGMESGNQKTLDLLNKGTTVEQNKEIGRIVIEEGLALQATYMVCLPGEDEEDAWNTFNIAKGIGAHIARFFLPTPYPKTRMYDLCKAEYPEVPTPHDSDRYDFLNYGNSYLPYVNPRIGKSRMLELAQHFEKSYYWSPKVLLRNLSQMRSTDDIIKYWTAFKAVYL